MTDAPVRMAIVKAVSIDCAAEAVHAYLRDARNGPQWAVVNVLAIAPGETPGWWRMTTPHGVGELRIRADAQSGLVDHDFRDPQASWTVYARVVPNGRGAHFSMTFLQPPAMTAAQFQEGTAQVEKELDTLKRILEAR